MHATIETIEYVFPQQELTTAHLAQQFPESSVAKIAARTGIHNRHIAAESECASDLAVAAAEKVFASGVTQPSSIDFILFCTQSPDYFLPTSACLIQKRLGIPTTAGALDFNLGSSGFIYGLGLAEGLIASNQASNILLLTADTYSKFIHPQDRSVRTIFGDAGAATLVTAVPSKVPILGPFVYGTDGSGAENLMVPAGGLRTPRSPQTSECTTDASGNTRSAENLFMNGPEVFNFTLDVVPACFQTLLAKANISLDSVDLFVFHQANLIMLNYLREKLGIPENKFCMALKDCGNTVSCSIPIALQPALKGLKAGARVVMVGFGVGYSWGATLWRYPGRASE